MNEPSTERVGRSIEIEGITHGHAPIPMGAGWQYDLFIWHHGEKSSQ